MQRPLGSETGLAADLARMPAGEALAANLDRAGFYESTERDRRDNCGGREVEWERPSEGIALTPDQLDAFRPVLDELVANLRLPAPESPGT